MSFFAFVPYFNFDSSLKEMIGETLSEKRPTRNTVLN